MMKLITSLCLLAASAFSATTNQISLYWDSAPDYDTGVTFYVYSKTNLAEPAWKPLTNVAWVDWTNTFKLRIAPATEASVFYTVTASNLFGETDFSEPAEARRLKRGSGVRIGAD